MGSGRRRRIRGVKEWANVKGFLNRGVVFVDVNVMSD